MRFPTTRRGRALTLLALVVTVAACGLPRSGPKKSEIYAGSVQKGGDAYVVAVTPYINRVTAVTPPLGFSGAFTSAGLIGSDTISAGDVLSLTVFENVKDDPLLGNTGQRVSQLAEVQVDGEGFIFVPYAGKILAAGQTPDGLREIITSKLDTQTPDPQIAVSRVGGDGQSVSLSGMIGAQGVYPIERPTRTLSAMIAKAGGISIEPAVAVIHVTRGSQSGQVWMQDLFDKPNLDIALRGGDRIVVERDQRAFTALGATGTQRQVSFETQDLSALEALAQVGGLDTGLADPTGVFVFRDEPASIANAVLGRNDLQSSQRVAYVLDLTQPTGIFEARDFMIRDDDTIYVTEAPFTQWSKTIAAITGTAGAANSVQSVGSSE